MKKEEKNQMSDCYMSECCFNYGSSKCNSSCKEYKKPEPDDCDIKHTPGPWTIEKNPDEFGKHNKNMFAISGSDWIQFAGVFNGCGFNDRMKKVALANVNLIITAPDMLKYITEMVRRYPNSPWIYKEGNAIIKKAKGNK